MTPVAERNLRVLAEAPTGRKPIRANDWKGSTPSSSTIMRCSVLELKINEVAKEIASQAILPVPPLERDLGLVGMLLGTRLVGRVRAILPMLEDTVASRSLQLRGR